MTRGMIARRLRTRLARDAGWMLLSQVGVVALQAAYFIIVARMLGVAGYGLLIAVTALAGIMAPIAMFGMATLVMRDVARDHAASDASWGNALLICTGLGTLLAILMTGLGWLVLPGAATVSLIACIAVADLILANVHQVHAQLMLASGRARSSALLMLMPTASRLACAVLAVAAGAAASAASWAVLYLAAACVTTLLGSIGTVRAFGRPRIDRTRLRGQLRLGSTYALGFSSMTVYNDIDKTMLARLDSVASAGAYAAGYRVVGMAMTPIFALLHATFARFFRHGAEGIDAARALARRIIPTAAGYGAAAGIVIWLCAPLAPILLGAGFADSVDTIRLLAVLPCIKAVQNVFGDVLTGSDRASTRTALQLGVAVVNVLCNLLLIPIWSFRGAIFATLACDTLLLVALWSAITWIARREQEAR